MLPFKVILFDLGSTLIYFDTDWTSVLTEGSRRLTRALASAGFRLNEDEFSTSFTQKLQEASTQRERDYTELTTESVLRSLLANKGYPNVPPIHLRPALNAMYSTSQPHWRVEEDANKTLESMRALGCRLGIISNAGDALDVYTLIKNAGLSSFFKKVWISAEVGYRKPHPRMFELALDYFQIRPGEAVMVGDVLGADILGANNLGIASVWITRRADTPENQANKLRIVPDQSIYSLDELPSLLMNW